MFSGEKKIPISSLIRVNFRSPVCDNELTWILMFLKAASHWEITIFVLKGSYLLKNLIHKQSNANSGETEKNLCEN